MHLLKSRTDNIVIVIILLICVYMTIMTMSGVHNCHQQHAIDKKYGNCMNHNKNEENCIMFNYIIHGTEKYV